jgi:hypothetical protein
MDLMIAMQQFATVINVRQTHWATARECDRPGSCSTFRAGIGAAACILIIAANTVQVIDTIASRDTIPEVQEILIITGRASALELLQFIIGEHPDTDPIAIRDPVFLLVGSQRMRITRFPAIFNINAEQGGSALTASVRTSPIANASEHDLISGRFAR